MKVCIIGHGPSAAGRGMGKVIDSHDLVIRHVECDWQNREDYGKKYDVGIFCPHPIEMAKDALAVPDFYWLYDPEAKYGKKTWAAGFRERPCRNLNEVVNPLINGRHFSRGTAAVIAAVKLLAPTKISLVGFDAVLRGSFDKNHHPAELSKMLRDRLLAGRAPRKLKFDTHEWDKEKRIIKTIGREYGVEVVALKG